MRKYNLKRWLLFTKQNKNEIETTKLKSKQLIFLLFPVLQIYNTSTKTLQKADIVKIIDT